MSTKIQIILPPVAEDEIEMGLCELTKILVEKELADEPGYGLGGHWGYGTNYENNIFMIHRFCWCGSEECPWCRVCSCDKEYDAEDEFWRKSCDDCENESTAPNFWYKPTNLKIWWYKWIGRDMEYNRKVSKEEWKQIFAHCVKSLEQEVK